MQELADKRNDYNDGRLEKSDVSSTPFEQFERWMRNALDKVSLDPTAFSLATADDQGRPSVRIVLLKGAANDRFTFFTNYNSRKAQDIAANPQAAMLFFWPELQRQIRISGPLAKVPRPESEEYFDSRPYESRIGAIASRQSAVLENRELLESRMDQLKQRHAEDSKVPLPEHWGGYRITALEYEFWQGRASRLHDRWRFRRTAVTSSDWQLDRLFP